MKVFASCDDGEIFGIKCQKQGGPKTDERQEKETAFRWRNIGSIFHLT